MVFVWPEAKQKDPFRDETSEIIHLKKIIRDLSVFLKNEIENKQSNNIKILSATPKSLQKT